MYNSIDEVNNSNTIVWKQNSNPLEYKYRGVKSFGSLYNKYDGSVNKNLAAEFKGLEYDWNDNRHPPQRMRRNPTIIDRFAVRW